MAAPPSLNQVYISESVLSKGAQLLLKTATFYLISRPGLSLLFPLRHAAAHLHESFPGRRREPPHATPLSPLSSFQEKTGRRRPPVEERRHALSKEGCGGRGFVWVWGGGRRPSLFNALFACCSVPRLWKWAEAERN